MKLNRFNKLAVQVNLILAASALPLLAESAPVNISQQPLAGVAIQYAPNIVLAISVEFPTAGAAYTTIGERAGREIKFNQHLNQEYLGYFNPKYCYAYTKTAKGYHFEPVGVMAGNDCPGEKDFSSNAMNFLTASALDNFRKALTGGNRAYGTGTDNAAYEAGDSATATYVRRSQPGWNSRAPQHTSMSGRAIDFTGATESDIKKFFPQSFVPLLKDITSGKTGTASRGEPNKLGFRKLPVGAGSKDAAAVSEGLRDGAALVSSGAYFADSKLYVTNNAFGAFFFRKLIDDSGVFYASVPEWAYDIVVQACKSGFPEEHCQSYGSISKPEGLLQKHGRAGMRVATFGYLNDDAYDADAPVLRSRMKYLDRKGGSHLAYEPEWSATTGQFNPNPDKADARAHSVTNSGAINYVNKFGDTSGYKTYDIGAELYYAALRYLRGGEKGSVGKVGKLKTRSVYQRDGLTDRMKDGFPAIYDWDDPLTTEFGADFAEALKNPEAQCRANNIIYIGDTNTHNDVNLPNFGVEKATNYKTEGFDEARGINPHYGKAATSKTPRVTDDIQTEIYLKVLLENEGLYGGSSPNRWDKHRGSSYSPSGMAGLAYWARVNDIRADIPGEQFGSNFLVDVAEGGSHTALKYPNAHPALANLKGQDNTYWLAAKYGGFDRSKAVNFAGNAAYKVPGNSNAEEREGWTSDAPNTSSIPNFFGRITPAAAQGIPRNFGIANNPKSMIESLEKAFSTVGDFDAPSQSALGLTTVPGERTDLTSGVLLALKTSYSIKEKPSVLSGDLTLSNITLDPTTKTLSNTDVWSANARLTARYGTGNAWMQRSVFTRDGNGFRALQEVTLTGADANSLRAYILGSNQDEDTLWRKRERAGLMGTIVYSSPISILKPKDANLDGCTFDASAMNRESHYAVAANDGMFHIFDSAGQEKLAYMPSTALPKLRAFAEKDAKHQFLNDGSPVYADVCFGTNARSVVVGTTGRGGAAVYALDVTSLQTAGTDKILWEFSDKDDPDLGLTVADVVISKDSSGRPVAIFSSGFNNTSGRGYLYVLDLSKTGAWQQNANYWKIPLGSGSVAGVGKPFAYDMDKDGKVDHVYVGDYNGNLWRVDHGTGSWTVANSGKAMFTPEAGKAAPITGAPFVDDVDGKIIVVFGTGQYLNEDASTPTTQNYAYGLIDDGLATTISPSALLEQSIIEESKQDFVNGTRRLRRLTDNEFDESKHKGWRLTLRKGQTISADALIRGGEVADFIAVNRQESSANANVCLPPGSTSILSLNLRTGGAYPSSPLFDTTGDSVVNDQDAQGGEYTLLDRTTPNLKQIPVEINGEKMNLVGGYADKGSGYVNMKDFEKKGGVSVLIRTTSREVPL